MRIIFGIIIIVAILVGLLYSPIGIPATYTEDYTMVITPNVDLSKSFKSSGTKIINAPVNQYYADNSETMSEGVNEGVNEGVIPNYSANTVSNNITTQGPTFQNNRFVDKNTSVPSNSGMLVTFGSKKSQVENSGQIVQNQDGVAILNTDLNTNYSEIYSSEPQKCYGNNYDPKTSECGRYIECHRHWHHHKEPRFHWIEEKCHDDCPNPVPIGDGLMILGLLVLLYVGYITFIIKQSKNHEK